MTANRTLLRNNTAFALIELLVVIAIISMLASILLPALSAARSSARRLVCQTHLREYGRGFSFYLSEHDDTFPAADYGPHQMRVRQPTWYQLVGNYLAVGEEYGEFLSHGRSRLETDGTALARCPELRIGHENNEILWDWSYDWRTLGYGYNRYWLGWNLFDRTPGGGDAAPKFWRRLVEVRNPAECLLVGDSGARTLALYPEVGPVAHYLGWRALAGRGSGVDTRHGARARRVPSRYLGQESLYWDGMGNVVWVDGHSSSHRAAQINQVVESRRFWDPAQRVGGW